RLLDRLPVGLVMVEQNYHIRAINVAARQLLNLHSAAVGDDLIHRAPPSMAGMLRAGIDAAFRDEATTAQQRLPDELLDDDGRDLAIAFCPPEGDEAETMTALAIVVVSDVTPLAEPLRRLDSEHDTLLAERDRHLARAEEAVAEVRERRHANQTLAIVNARLRSEIEDLMVANEEAQAAAEEIETLNEELQATNEELETLNEELQATVEELTATNDELQARTLEIKASTDAQDARHESTSGSDGAPTR
ncbi:MAG TPA: hypothetical protein VFX03_04725, partial [Thermomicrobiales bacterium]|nr:hypothetical protein [Thermomicrobiales bacterium]